MPSKSKSQQRLFGMALAVRRGEMKRSDAYKEVLDIADSDITDKELEAFAKHRTSDKEHNVKESQDMFQKYSDDLLKNHVKNRSVRRVRPAGDNTRLATYLKQMHYAGKMIPAIETKPDIKYIFIVIKPGFTKLSETIISRFINDGFKLYKTRSKRLTLGEARKLYKVHSAEDFYDALCEYMSSDISIGVLFSYDGMTEKEAFKKVGTLKDEIRNEYSESDMRNVMHSSDNTQTMRLESSVYFNELI